MNKFWILLLLKSLVITTGVKAQAKQGIISIHGFSREQMPGNIPRPGSGIKAGPDTIYTIYVISSGKEITWEMAWGNGKTFRVKATRLNENSIEPGIDKKTGKTLRLTATKGQTIWILELERSEMLQKPGELKKGILLKGHYNGKTFLRRLTRLVELRSIPSV